MAKQVLFVVAEIPDAGLANEILHLIREDEKKKAGAEGHFEVVTMNEEQWELNKSAFLSDGRVLFLGSLHQRKHFGHPLPVRFEKYGIRYGWKGPYAFLTTDKKVLKNEKTYAEFLKELKALCTLDDITRSPRRLDILQMLGMLCVALLVPFGSVLVGGKLLADWYSNDNYVEKQQYVYGVLHLYKYHLKEFMTAPLEKSEI